MNMNRCPLPFALALAGILTLQPLARAADAPAGAQPAPAGRGVNLRERLQQIAAELELSEEQHQKVQTILHNQIDKLRELRQDAALSQAEKAAKFKAMREEIAAEVKELLTPEQLARLKDKSGQFLGAADGALEQLQQATKRLNLTEEQKEKLKPLYQAQIEKLRALHQDTSLSLQEKLEKLKALQQEAVPELKKVLDAAQLEQWQKGVDQWLEGLKQRLSSRSQGADQPH